MGRKNINKLKGVKMTGIELLKLIQRGDLKDDTTIFVYEYGKLKTSLRYDGLNLIWQPDTFKTNMLWEDEIYTFKIYPRLDLWQNIENLDKSLTSLGEIITKLINNQRY